MTKYSPTEKPGETRTRSRYIGITNTLGQYPSVNVLEQTQPDQTR